MIKRSKSSRTRKRKRPTKTVIKTSVNYVSVVLFAVIGGLVILGLLLVGRFFGDRLVDSTGPTAVTIDDSVVDRIDDILPTVPPTATPTVAPTLTPTPTPEQNLKVEDYTVQILNGNGRAGEAQSVRTQLESNGFTISNVNNAARWDYSKTEIRGTDKVPLAVLEEAENALDELYITEITSDTNNTNSYDILIILGRDQP